MVGSTVVEDNRGSPSNLAFPAPGMILWIGDEAGHAPLEQLSLWEERGFADTGDAMILPWRRNATNSNSYSIQRMKSGLRPERQPWQRKHGGFAAACVTFQQKEMP
jgi:hypothetical protein